MKNTKPYAFVVALALSAALATTGFSKPKPKPAASAAPAPATKFNVDVQCLSCAPPVSNKATAMPIKNGGYTVDVPSAGQYKISYADGPNKGKLVANVSAGAAGSVTFGTNGESSAPPPPRR